MTFTTLIFTRMVSRQLQSSTTSRKDTDLHENSAYSLVVDTESQMDGRGHHIRRFSFQFITSAKVDTVCGNVTKDIHARKLYCYNNPDNFAYNY